MKKYLMALTYVAFISFMVHQKATAQDNEDDIELEPARNIIKIAPFQFVDNTFFLAYEGFMPDFTKSINVGIGFKTRNGFNSEELGFKYEIQYRFYVNGFKEHVPKKSEAKYRRGIYASVYLAGLRTEITSDFNSFDPVGNFTMFRTNERTISAFNPGVTIGIQRSIWEILYIDFFVGGGVRFANITDSDDLFPQNRFSVSDIYEPDYEGVFPKIGINIGIGF